METKTREYVKSTNRSNVLVKQVFMFLEFVVKNNVDNINMRDYIRFSCQKKYGGIILHYNNYQEIDLTAWLLRA